jgi:F0F1-type ATP synthase assembly protein I
MADMDRLGTRTNESLEDSGIDESPMFASYGIIGAIMVFGTVGYLLDRWLGTAPSLLLVGLATGVAIGFFGLASALRHR